MLLKLFTGRVPGEFISIDRDTATVLCPCKPEIPPAIAFNVPTPCTGDCGRWFFFNLTDVLVAVMPDSPAAAHVQQLLEQRRRAARATSD